MLFFKRDLTESVETEIERNDTPQSAPPTCDRPITEESREENKNLVAKLLALLICDEDRDSFQKPSSPAVNEHEGEA